MKKKVLTVVSLIVLFSFFIAVFIYSKEVAESITFSISIWKDNLLPSLFPFFLMSELLMEYGFIEFISFIFGKYMVYFFYLPKETSYAFFVSLFSGFPSGSKYVKDLLTRGLITEEEANYLIMFTHYSNPLFIVSTIGILLLNNLKYGYIILISHIISNIMVAFIFRKKKFISYRKEKFIHLIDEISNRKKKKFITVLVDAIWKSFKVLVNMLGIIMFFLIITTLIDSIISLNGFPRAIISGFLEMTQGVKFVSQMDISINIKAAIIGSIISFSGLSVHFQVKSIIDGSKIKYQNFLIARIIQSILCFFIILGMSRLFC